jgi:uncharacterized protein (PEP-CTERM system associated)
MVTKMCRARGERGRHPGLALLPQLLGLAGGLIVSAAGAQTGEAGARAGLNLQPRLSVSQTFTDNLRLAETGQDQALILTVAPGLSLSSRAGMLRGSLDYSLNGLFYSKTDQANRVQHYLTSQGTAELLARRLFVDVRATVGQQTVSAFAATSTDPALVDNNRRETASLAVSPFLRGQLAGLFGYEFRADGSVTRVKDSEVGDSSSQGLALRINGLGGGRGLGWGASLTEQRQMPRYGRETLVDTAELTLNYRPDVDWMLSGSGGWQRSDLNALQSRDGATYGASLTWTPTPRTKLAADARHQSFGDTHSLSFEHRMARSVFRLSDSRNLAVGQVGASGVQGNYELLFLQFASDEPDPVKRDLLVRQYLQANGLGQGNVSTGGFLSSSTSLTRRQEFSAAWTGRRTTATLSLSQSRSERLGVAASVGDDFSQSGVVLQRGASLALSHRLAPDSNLTFTLSEQQGRGDAASQKTDLKSVLAIWSISLARRSSLQLGLRHSSFDSQARSYRENAVLATYVHQF